MKKFLNTAKKVILLYIVYVLTVLNVCLTVSAENSTSKKHAIYSLKIELSGSTSAQICILAEDDCSLFVALYDEYNKLIVSKQSSVTGNAEKQEISLKITENETKFYYAKAFLWNEANCEPLCQSSLSFNTDNSTAWECKADAYYDTELQQYVLTDDYRAWSAGVIWFDKQLQGNFTIDLDYYTGSPHRSLNGGDGMVIAFFANSDYSIQPTLGFTSNGYGIELDTWSNSNCSDPSYNHIALIKDDIGNHCSYAALPESKDESWHHLKIVVKDNICSAYVDGSLKISEKVSSTGYSGLGISAGTGDAVNLHAVKNILVTY